MVFVKTGAAEVPSSTLEKMQKRKLCRNFHSHFILSMIFPLLIALQPGTSTELNAAETLIEAGEAQQCFQEAASNLASASGEYCLLAIRNGTLSDENLAASYSNQGLIHARQKRFTRALKAHSKAIALQPKLERAYINRGNAYFGLKRYTDANADYSKAITLSGGSIHQAFYNRSLVFKALGYQQRAREELEHALLLAPENLLYIDALTLRPRYFR